MTHVRPCLAFVLDAHTSVQKKAHRIYADVLQAAGLNILGAIWRIIEVPNSNLNRFCTQRCTPRAGGGRARPRRGALGPGQPPRGTRCRGAPGHGPQPPTPRGSCTAQYRTWATAGRSGQSCTESSMFVQEVEKRDNIIERVNPARKAACLFTKWKREKPSLC
jgi:hypothetical protein